MSERQEEMPFGVISGAQVKRVLSGRERQITELVEAVYRLHGDGDTVNPPSYFLRFPDRPNSRIIALPAAVGGDRPTAGLKWISSFPDNLSLGVPRASAVLVLNDRVTGYPFACMESSIISAARTAASAAAAAHWLTRRRGRPRRIGFVGTGLIARYVHTFLAANDWTFDSVGVHDLSEDYAGSFSDYLQRSGNDLVTVHKTAEELITSSDIIVFATTAGTPHVTERSWFAHHPLVLHVSLRDLAPEILLDSYNIVDDVEHCLKANTSPHLAEQLTGNRDFLHGTLYDVMADRAPQHLGDRPMIFSPFGLGVLDLAVGTYIHDELRSRNEVLLIPEFFHEMNRYGEGDSPSDRH